MKKLVSLGVIVIVCFFTLASAQQEAKNQFQLTLKAVKSLYKAGEKIEIIATLTNLSNQKKTLKETKQVKFTLYNPQFDIYISGKGTNGTQYLNMMGMFGGDKKTGIILMPKGLHTWTLQESTQPKMVNGTPYGTALPPGQYQVYAEGAGLKSNEVKITIKKN